MMNASFGFRIAGVFMALAAANHGFACDGSDPIYGGFSCDGSDPIYGGLVKAPDPIQCAAGDAAACTPVASRDIAAGPIWSNADAAVKCPAVCAAEGSTWNGQWTTSIRGVESACGCVAE